MSGRVLIVTITESVITGSEIEENDRMGKTRDHFKKIRDTKGTFYAKMGSIKDRNGMDLTEAEDIKKRCKNTQKNYTKKIFMTQITMCYAQCPNPRVGREKASKTTQLTKKGKFIADLSQGSRRTSARPTQGQRALSPSCYPIYKVCISSW